MASQSSTAVTDLFSAKGLVVVITGGSSGIGVYFATALARNGAAKIFILGRRSDKLDSVAKQIDANVVVPVACDVSDGAAVAAAGKKIESQTEYIDVLVNNAGIIGPEHDKLHELKTIEELSALMLSQQDKWAQTHAINTTSVIIVSGAFLPLLDRGNVRRGWPSGWRTEHIRDTVPDGIDPTDERTSQIITVASIASFNREVTAGLAYTSSKAGAMMLGKSMANFLAPFGIRSNIIAPGS